VNPSPLDITLEEHASAHVLTLRGEVDLATAPALSDAIDAALATPVALVVVDLRGLTFLPSAGLSALVEGHRKAQARGRGFVVVAKGRVTLQPIRITGLDEVLTIVDTVEAALDTQAD
jgi:anti-sigma B factor antagonist